ncbi:N-acetylglucosamine-6-phosphate deacetylase [Sansalvadorimonas sp. 2012CJ34-2]|uniref:N-acetylglucosamine-6-phosphate deacetylase n=1 Tax=Parendozoicomonas callyspongiae TaxID=2942213 RepID=A0ABT0PMR6_9GAMM|nr:N-acetylglucosamine-6-phosphate deacetylase [Sansalvadorimonas sp. 2012CJ34-2]MCL6271768.1 N-acetylglucosamine-6-phosphate deacetylase [Sansalvadorimonas sp. 2012CJ34-2]
MLICLLVTIASQAADRVCVRASKVLIGKNLEHDRIVIIHNGVIEQVRPWHESLRKKCASLSEVQGVLSPGLIDIHIHGAGGNDVMDAADSPDALSTISKTLLKEGVTTWLPTTTSASPDKLSTVLASIAQYTKNQRDDEARIAGIHMEGPFISKDKSGCHPHDSIMPIDLDLQSKWFRDSQNSIRVVTFAPELKQSDDLIRWCNQNKVVPSIGHTNASEHVIKHAISTGAGLGTHLYNAMSQTKSRDAGAAMSILEHQSLPFEIILDGVHLSEPLVRIAWHLSKKHPDRFILITDAIRAKGLPDSNGTFELGDGIKVKVSGFRAAMADKPNTLAGSVLTLPYAIQTMQRITDCSLAEALIAATYSPAKAIHMQDKIGRLAPGLAADMVLFSDTNQLSVISVWRNGHVINPL